MPRRLGRLFQAVGDAGFGQIVRGHLEPHPISHREPDEVFPHFAGKMSQHFMLIVQLHPEHSSGKNRGDGPLEFDWLFVCQMELRYAVSFTISYLPELSGSVFPGLNARALFDFGENVSLTFAPLIFNDVRRSGTEAL